MKNKRFIETTLRFIALGILAMYAAKCTAQDIRVNTAVGLIVFYQSDQPDEICFSFGVENGELKVEHLDRTAKNLYGKVAAAARMADNAGVNYSNFLRENQINDSPAMQEYYYKCLVLRRQFLKVIPERALLEVRHLVKNNF